MLFSSLTFLYLFLPIVLIVYFLVPKNWKNGVLLLASLVFYFFGERAYTALMVLASLSGYVHGLLIDRFRGRVLSKVFLISSLVVGLGMLVYFKYTDFFLSNINLLLGTEIPLLRVIMPIGISFFTFQILSYTIDVYRGKAKVQKNFFKLATYVSLFPQLIAGPIVRYTTVAEELDHRTHSVSDAAYGTVRFLIGLGKKVLIANQLGAFVEVFRNAAEPTVLFYWLYAVAYTLQIYFDFSGYSDMAIGLGRIFGFHFLENFNYPFISSSVTEFWRRWHISLGTWFRDYVYIPLGGNRVKLPRHLFNIFVVWMITGFWHGANWNFILWGLFFAVFLIAEKLTKKYFERIPRVLRHIYLLLIVVISFVLFNATSLNECIRDLGGMFGFGGLPFSGSETLYYLKSYAVLFLVAVVGSTPLCKRCVEELRKRPNGKTALSVLTPVFAAVLLLVVTAYLVDGGFNPFLYFRF